MATVFWTIVCIDDQLVFVPVAFFYLLPPLLQGITDKISGFVRSAIEYLELVIFQVENPHALNLPSNSIFWSNTSAGKR